MNEDAFLVLPLRNVSRGESMAWPGGGGGDSPSMGVPDCILAVADGLGGAPAGERASWIAIQALHRHIEALLPRLAMARRRKREIFGSLKWIARECHREIESDLNGHPERVGMGTTLTAALVLWPKVYGIHVGDSRCYHYRHRRLEVLTVDHTVSQQLADLGMPSAKVIPPSRWRNTLWNVIGGRSSSHAPNRFSVDLRPGDVLLLATDGVTDAIPDGRLESLLAKGGGSEEICDRLIRAARERDGKDDRTVVCACFGRSGVWPRIRRFLFGG
ncbi:MAG TPA: protein phosphatase 2C domain-containing protein [Planctomycetota bacterium]|nr:protein phosphatase 2C domain-containing protein [Planctomycetota bacterium]